MKIIVTLIAIVCITVMGLYANYKSEEARALVTKDECGKALQGCETVAKQCLNDVLEAEYKLNLCLDALMK